MYGGNHHTIVIVFQLKINKGGKKAQIHPPDFTNIMFYQLMWVFLQSNGIDIHFIFVV